MIRLSGLKLPLDHPAEAMPAAICARLNIQPQELRGHNLVRRGNDARRRNAIQLVYTLDIDVENEAAVLDALAVVLSGRTSIVIAHRLSTIRDMHRIHVLDRGQLVESGTHEELVAARGVYHRLYRLQQDSRSETAQALASA